MVFSVMLITNQLVVFLEMRHFQLQEIKLVDYLLHKQANLLLNQQVLVCMVKVVEPLNQQWLEEIYLVQVKPLLDFLEELLPLKRVV